VVLSGASKAAFEELTIELCQQRLAPEKAEATVNKLRRKQAKDWPKVCGVCCKTQATAAAATAAAATSWMGSGLGVRVCKIVTAVAAAGNGQKNCKRTLPTSMGEFMPNLRTA
jgi:hypothetical protein